MSVGNRFYLIASADAFSAALMLVGVLTERDRLFYPGVAGMGLFTTIMLLSILFDAMRGKS